MKNIRKYLTNNLAYGEAGHRDQQKQMEDVVIRNRKGRLHFIRFPTSVMRAFLDLAKEKGMAETISTGKHHVYIPSEGSKSIFGKHHINSMQ